MPAPKLTRHSPTTSYTESLKINTKTTMIQLDPKYKSVLLEAVEEQMYKTSLKLETYKGKPLTKERKILIKKQSDLEEIQHVIHTTGA